MTPDPRLPPSTGPLTDGAPATDGPAGVAPETSPAPSAGSTGTVGVPADRVPADEARPVESAERRVVPTRASAAWTVAVGATVVLLLLAVFVGQNTQRAGINFLWLHGHAPIAVLLLVAAVAGAALVAAAGAARILQLRHRGSGRRSRRRTGTAAG